MSLEEEEEDGPSAIGHFQSLGHIPGFLTFPRPPVEVEARHFAR